MKDSVITAGTALGASLTAVEGLDMNPSVWTVFIIPVVTGVLIPWLRKIIKLKPNETLKK